MRGILSKFGFLAWAAVTLAACLDDGGGGGGGGTITLTEGYVFVRDDDIFVADRADYSEVGQLTENGSNKHPALSANLLQAVYVNAPSGAAHSIRAVATNGSGTPRTLYTAEPGETNFRNPVFSPDGSKVVFAYDGAGGTSTLAWVDSSGTGGITNITSGSANYASPTFYADGTSVLAMTGSGTTYTRLEKVNITTGAVTVVASSLGGDAEQISGRVVLSPDENNVAFDGRVLGGNPAVSRIFVKDITQATTDAVQLTEHAGSEASALDLSPTWVSSSRIGFSSNAGGLDNVYEINITVSAPGSGTLTVASSRDPWFGP